MYDAAFFDVIRKGCQDSAAVVAPIVHKLLRPKTVIDVGCGEGWWAKAFEDLGCAVVGVDGPDTRPVIEAYRTADLAQPLAGAVGDLGEFDLAVSLEVAEHLPPERADSFIADLCTLAPAVLFSAAIPGQGGTGHTNEQWPGYWAERFDVQGYDVTGALRWQIWDDDRVENWYRQNLLLAARRPVRQTRRVGGMAPLFKGPHAAPIPVVHPVLFDARRR